jgi:hypothetical protein
MKPLKCAILVLYTLSSTGNALGEVAALALARGKTPIGVPQLFHRHCTYAGTPLS